jgi:preprotein translocase subunit SecG
MSIFHVADSGNMANAEEKTRTARNLTIVTVVLGVICIALVMVLRLVVFTTSSAKGYY